MHLLSLASSWCWVSNHPLHFSSQVPAPVDRRAGDLPDQSGRDRADLFQLRPPAPVPHLLPARERPSPASRSLPL